MSRKVAMFIFVPLLIVLSNLTIPLVCDKVLLLPFPWPSHYTQLEKIGMELASRGHEVVIITPSSETYRTQSPLKKIEYKIAGLSRNTFVGIAEKRLETSAGFGVSWLIEYIKLLDAFGRALLADRGVKKAANGADLVISDTAFMVAPIFADYHKIPLIFLSPFGHLPGCMAETFGNIENPSLVPTFVATALFENIGLPQKMSFMQRNFNLISNIISKILRDTITIPMLRPLTKMYSKKSLLELWEQVSLLMIPMDYSIEYPRPDLPIVKMIGPLTPSDKNEHLKAPFDTIVKDSTMDIVVVSFGITNRLSSQATLRILEGLVTTGYTVIWKYDRKKLAGMIKDHHYQSRFEVNGVLCEGGEQQYAFKNESESSIAINNTTQNYCLQTGPLRIGNNVYVFDWLPQQQLLRQSKTKLLVSHCGLNSLYEALYHNTKVLCVPLFGEQFDNAGRVVSRNLGKALTVQEINAESLRRTIRELATCKLYAENVKRVSQRLKRAEPKPVEQAVYWIEYVLAEKGDTSHLKPVKTSYFQYYMIDVFLFWAAIVYMIYKVLHTILRFDYEFGRCHK